MRITYIVFGLIFVAIGISLLVKGNGNSASGGIQVALGVGWLLVAVFKGRRSASHPKSEHGGAWPPGAKREPVSASRDRNPPRRFQGSDHVLWPKHRVEDLLRDVGQRDERHCAHYQSVSVGRREEGHADEDERDR
jgi:hypothetical protein